MGQLAFAAVGAVVSTAAGVGPAIGWAVGSAIGGVVFAPDGPQTQGPRLEDLKSNVSTYGQPIPRCYGQIGFMTSLIWMDDLTEYASVEEASKGGDPASVTTFTYSASFASILCRGEVSTIPNSVAVTALNRIWVNEKCYYDIRDPSNLDAMVASGNFAQYFKFYPGNQTQLPDPTMEAILGVGNVPAYRGRSYIVFTDLPLAFVQNQPPGALRITCEVTMTGTPDTGLRFLWEQQSQGGGNTSYMQPITENVIRLADATDLVFVNDVRGNLLSLDTKTEEELEEWPDIGLAGDGTIAITRLVGGSKLRGYQTSVGTPINDPAQRLYAQVEDGGDVSALPLLPNQTDLIVSVVASTDQRHVFVFVGTIIMGGVVVHGYHLLQWDDADAEWILVRTGTVVGTGHIPPAIGPASQGYFYAGIAENDLKHIWYFRTAGAGGFILNEVLDDDSVVQVGTLTDANVPLFGSALIWAENGVAYAYGTNRFYVATRNDGGAVNNQTLQEVHEAECSLAGLAPASVDASALASIIVDGMFIRRLGPTRGVIGILEPSYFYDTVESSGALKAVLRGGSSIVTITEDDLGAGIGQAEADLINPDRAEEDSLPGAAIVTYIDRASDYQVAAQHDRRSAVETSQPVSLEMPLVFSPDQARQIGSVWLYNQWAGRTKRTVKLSRRYSYLEPTDVITLRTDIADFVVRIVAIKTNEGFLEVECVDEDAALYTQNATGANIDQSTNIQTPTPTKLVLLDIPMLRESDNDAGFYLAAAGYGPTWPGALILRSIDGGVVYSTVASVNVAATMGNVEIALPDYTGVLGYDSVNSIVVTLFDSSDTLQSVTDAELLAGANAFALGSSTAGYEIAQFKTATLISGNSYRLTELLRGRRGTEHEMAGHGAYETFVLLEASKMRRIAADSPSIGIVNHYKAVTVGQLVTSAATQTFTNTAAGLKPYSPIDGKATGFGGDITITWTRRGRIYNDWNDGVELPLGEATESYSIDIYSGSTVVRTLTSSTPTVTYTAAQQATDWGSPNPSSLSVRIYQLSAIVGRGFPLIATLS